MAAKAVAAQAARADGRLCLLVGAHAAGSCRRGRGSGQRRSHCLASALASVVASKVTTISAFMAARESCVWPHRGLRSSAEGGPGSDSVNAPLAVALPAQALSYSAGAALPVAELAPPMLCSTMSGSSSMPSMYPMSSASHRTAFRKYRKRTQCSTCWQSLATAGSWCSHCAVPRTTLRPWFAELAGNVRKPVPVPVPVPAPALVPGRACPAACPRPAPTWDMLALRRHPACAPGVQEGLHPGLNHLREQQSSGPWVWVNEQSPSGPLPQTRNMRASGPAGQPAGQRASRPAGEHSQPASWPGGPCCAPACAARLRCGT